MSPTLHISVAGSTRGNIGKRFARILAVDDRVETLLRDLRCSKCSASYPVRLNGSCDACGAILLATYEEVHTAESLQPCEPIRLGERDTPLVERHGFMVKDERSLPTGTFKARGAAIGVAMAKKLGAVGVALPSAGNAGAAWAAYCEAAAMPCATWMASDAPAEAIRRAWSYGAEVTVVEGDIGDAGAQAKRAAQERGWHYAATFAEPWRVEGKKSALFEIVRALDGRLPDAAVLPVGGGVGVVAWHKAAEELRTFGLASGSTRLYAVQADGCAPIVRAFERADEDIVPWEKPKTSAAGIRIPAPRAGSLVLQALRESGGGAVEATEQEIALAGRDLGGTFLAESAAAWAGAKKLREAGVVRASETVVVYATG